MAVVITVLLSLLALALLFFLGVMIFFTVHLRHLRKIQSNDELLIGDKDASKRALLIFQGSRHTSAKQVALSIAENLAANGFCVTINHPRPDLAYNWSDYELIALGSPVYLGQVSPTLKYYVQNHQTSGMPFLLWAVGLQRDETVQLTEMADWLGAENGFDAKKFWLREDLNAKDFVEQSLRNWAKSTGPYFKLHAQAAPGELEAQTQG